MKKNLLQLLILLMMMPFVSQAQITTGTIQGVIKKGDGPAAAALIKAIHLPSGSVYAGRSSSNGNYVINGVRVGGPYKVTASALGGGEVDVEDIYVKLGTPAQVNLNLTKSSQELQKVVVSGVKNSIFNADKTGASTNVTGAQMQVLPTLDRNVSDFTRLTPQSGSSIGNANSFAGRDARYNNFQVNGANLNNGFGLSGGLTPGGSGSPISIDAIEDLQIAISPYDIKNAGFTGANVNAVTRSGTNEFHGSIYGFYRG
ncbi:MAG: carboxypeptidase-like regulatory domain-containing protein, partial [Chitinophagales bacterium]|nr:carboxypeptidase-like regulatory domain-containing protein [Chitinophagales bacterium]